MEFKYLQTIEKLAVLDIEDLGNVAIEANNDLHECYYLVIKTALGTTNIFQYGPITPESQLLPKTVTCSFKRIEFKEIAIKKIIDIFLNNPYATITQAREIAAEEAYNNCINIIEYMQKEENF